MCILHNSVEETVREVNKYLRVCDMEATCIELQLFAALVLFCDLHLANE
jgi:hypothetical protein